MAQLTLTRKGFAPEHETFRELVRSFFADEVRPAYPQWEAIGRPPREFWTRAGELGLLGVMVPEEHGGLAGSSFRHSVAITEEAQRFGFTLGGLRIQTDIVLPYLLEYATEEQRARWLPRMADGSAVTALAMSEPGAGSDMKAMATTAVRDGDHYVVNGAKTFITNGLSADLLIVAVKTDPAAGRHGISLLVVEAPCPGFERGRKLEKLGLRTQDLAELSFTDVAVSVDNLLGEENRGFEYLSANLAQERLSIAVNCQAAAAAVLDATLREVGRADQHTKFELAACCADVRAGQALVDAALDDHDARNLSAGDAAVVKLFTTELQGRVADRCLQVLGPRAYARTSAVGRGYADARVSRIYGGSSEIMKVIIAKDLGL